jgi:hypothetical protein
MSLMPVLAVPEYLRTATPGPGGSIPRYRLTRPALLRQVSSLALSALLSTAAIASTVQPAFAACAPPRTGAGGTYNATAALDLTPGTVNGVSALLEEYNPYTTDATGTNVSVMLTQTNGSGWAQLGWFETRIQAPNGTIGAWHRSVGVEFHPVNTAPNWQFWPAEPIGQMTWYQIQYATGASVFDFFLEGTHIWAENEQMFINTYEVMGETHNRKDQFPGSVSNHVVMNNVRYFTTPGFTPHVSTIHIAANPNAAPFVGLWPPNQQTANGRYEIWDTGCP